MLQLTVTVITAVRKDRYSTGAVSCPPSTVKVTLTYLENPTLPLSRYPCILDDRSTPHLCVSRFSLDNLRINRSTAHPCVRACCDVRVNPTSLVKPRIYNCSAPTLLSEYQSHHWIILLYARVSADVKVTRTSLHYLRITALPLKPSLRVTPIPLD